VVAAALPAMRPPVIRVGSKNFTEQIILGEILAQAIEQAAGLPVERRLNLGGTFICDRAIRAGEIDLYVEYSGTAHTAVLKQEPDTDPQRVLETVRRLYGDAGLAVLDPLGFENTFAILVRGKDARRLGLRTISDAARHAAGWRAGFGYEFLQRADGYPGLARIYDLRLGGPPQAMDLSLTYRAVAERQIDITADATIVARGAVLLAHPELKRTLVALSGRMTVADMRRLNQAVDAGRRDAADVAREFVAGLGLPPAGE
jgi:glycine betaine/choline ABC-type transport system substrate-binding protein